MKLKNKFTLTVLIVFAISSNQVIAQTPDDIEPINNPLTGRVILQPYIGGPNMKKWFYDGNDYNSASSKGTLHYGVSGEYVISNRFGIGFDVIYSPFSRTVDSYDYYIDPETGYQFTTTEKMDIIENKLRILPRVYIHFNVDDPTWDVYISGGIGVNVINRKYEIDGKSVYKPNDYYYDDFPILDPHFPYAGRVSFGSRFYFNKNLGINFETGIGGPAFVLGLTARFL